MEPATDSTVLACTLLEGFAQRTGLTSDQPPRRYLWTDAFAVCTLLGLARRTGDPRHVELALGLVDRVHHVLGRYRPDNQRQGWISDLDEQTGEQHPTRGGLRIGKTLDERRADQPFDERLEWERDGQYFHYLTRWMHALDLVARTTRQARFNLWARELAKVAHDAFVYATPRNGHHMFWKMSIDLSRPLVASMGHHDPLDGFITCVELQQTASLLRSQEEPRLLQESEDFASMIERRDLATADLLGIGGLLSDAARVAQAMAIEAGGEELEGEALMEELFLAAARGLSHHSTLDQLRAPASQRLAFRELGLAIGLSAIALVAREVEAGRLHFPASARFADGVELLEPFAALGPRIVSFWTDALHREIRSWRDHQDINDVMLASSLVPDGYVLCPPVA